MALLSRKTLWAFAEESSPGSVETLAATDVVKAVLDKPADMGTVTPLLFDDNTVHSELGEHPQFAPNVASWETPPIRIAAAGHAASTTSTVTKLPYGRMIESCGFEALDADSSINPVEAVTIGSVTGATRFIHGETVTAATGEEGVVIGDCWNGTTTLFIEDTAGSGFSNGTITGSTSGATATISASAAQNPHAYRLLSNPDTPVALTGGKYFDGKLMRGAGMRGNLKVVAEHANRPFFEFMHKGVLYNAGASSYHVTDTSFPTGVTYYDRTAPAFLGVSLVLNDGTNSLTAAFNRFELDLGNEVVLQENSNETDGYDVARIVQRAPRLRINPREVLESSYTFLDNLIRGVTCRARVQIGTYGSGNSFLFMLPFLQAEGLTSADRDSVLEWDGTFRCTKGSFTSSGGETTIGANNEVVIVHS